MSAAAHRQIAGRYLQHLLDLEQLLVIERDHVKDCITSNSRFHVRHGILDACAAIEKIDTMIWCADNLEGQR
jgi:hypothetical protein